MTSPPATDPGRLRSVDAYRGFVMLLDGIRRHRDVRIFDRL